MTPFKNNPSDGSVLSRAQELMFELRVKDIMNTSVIAVAPEISMRELMTVLREKRVSGVPVVRDGSVSGIISMEDLIRVLAEDRIHDLVADHMTRQVTGIGPDETLFDAMKLFEKHGFGRLPVIDREGLLAGIITKGDITRGILNELLKVSRTDEIRKYRVSHLFEDTISDSTSLVLRYNVAPKDFEEGGKASSTMKRMFERLGIEHELTKRITISAYEAEMNLIIHTEEGGQIRVEISPERIILITEDKGPGIEDVALALKPGYSTAPDWVRALGFGAGMGLCNIKRNSDEISLRSEPGKGTILTAVFAIKQQPPSGTAAP